MITITPGEALEAFLVPELKQDIKEIFTADCTKESFVRNVLQFILTSAVSILEVGYTVVEPEEAWGTDSTDSKFQHRYVTEVFDFGHRFWLELVDYIRSNYEVELSQLDFIFALLFLLEKMVDRDAQKQIADIWKYAIRDVVYRISFDMQDAYNQTVDRAKMAENVTKANPEDIKDFFQKFQELTIYRRDRDSYELSSDQALYDKTTELFQRIVGDDCYKDEQRA